MSLNCPRCPGVSFTIRHRFVPVLECAGAMVGLLQARNTRTSPNIFEMRPPCALFAHPLSIAGRRLPCMNGISLLLCKSATERYDELNSWLYVALVAITLIIFDKGAELVVLELAFFVALCIRQGAAVAARAIRKSNNQASALAVLERAESREMQHRIAGIRHMTTVTTRRRSLESRQASFSSLGLPHPGLTARLLPLPILLARQ